MFTTLDVSQSQLHFWVDKYSEERETVETSGGYELAHLLATFCHSGKSPHRRNQNLILMRLLVPIQIIDGVKVLKEGQHKETTSLQVY